MTKNKPRRSVPSGGRARRGAPACTGSRRVTRHSRSGEIARHSEGSETALQRFLRYVRIDTQSCEGCDQVPSTARQFDLQRLLERELRTLGARSVKLDRHAYLMARLPANLPRTHPARGRVPRVGLIAHVDTSPSAPGAGVDPRVVEYQGGDLALPGDPTVVIRADENPALAGNVGKNIVTSDGTTLLGADDKAGVAIIMTALAEMQAHPERLHGEICVAFTPDEEVGNGTRFFDLKRFGADVAYTVDGGGDGEVSRETFSGDAATITVHGRSIHPGRAKNVMVNAVRVIADVVARTRKDMSPEMTEGTQPFIHPYRLQADESKAVLKLLLRDFRTEGLAEQEAILRRIIAEVQALYPRARVELEVKKSYRNMRDGLEKEPRVTEALEEAVRRAGADPQWKPIRGGTDGSFLTEMGLPTPNLFTGGLASHGSTEWLSVEAMNRSVQAVLHLAEIWVERA
jgi:tripeptide aminopeptidase